ncbi:glycosyltransferase family 4 protein [Crocosphaera sp. UHCC 0190]|uniref:glycosyltransferase family 4 protein n=1 Tax=Crocosphaera sp. UHCC 0190 TaxID=3110246 RepID=UPI002B219E99|nr:glycosyltransferase family 4 protein [Crocosphaera sp. UHCC 0190]MEA5509369.1 glycosyltransferase family 4 protein [Crocosphaera sp. UHCC 0190]
MNDIRQSVKPKYLLISHHPKDRSISPCTTVYNVFLSPKAVYPYADYIFVHSSPKQFKQELREKTENQNVTLLFNGCCSLLSDNAIYALKYAKKNNLSVIIYWHEMAWQLNQHFASFTDQQWEKINQMLQESYVKHWVPFSQAKQLIMYIFKRNYEDVLIVTEAIDLDDYIPKNQSNLSNNIKLLGSGSVANIETCFRKGTDYFCKICQELSQNSSDLNFDGYWFGASEEEVSKFSLDIPDNCHFLGFVDNLPTQFPDYDIFLLTSRDDPSPIVAFEALACNLPVFCFDSVGTREMLPPEFVASDIDMMINNIINYCYHQEKYSPNFFRKIAEDYAPQKFLERIDRKHNLITIDQNKYFKKYSEQKEIKIKQDALKNEHSFIRKIARRMKNYLRKS